MANAFRIAGIGELLYDVLPAGKQLGGAPANFAFHAQRLGLDAYPVSAVGKDADGQAIMNELTRAGLSTKYIQQVDSPTGTAQVLLNAGGTPHFTISENVAWDHIQWTDDNFLRVRRPPSIPQLWRDASDAIIQWRSMAAQIFANWS